MVERREDRIHEMRNRESERARRWRGADGARRWCEAEKLDGANK